MTIINEDGTLVLIEVVFGREYVIYRSKHDSIEDALRFIKAGEDYGEISSVGIYLDGEPRIWDGYLSQDYPDGYQERRMAGYYTKSREYEDELFSFGE